MFFQANFKMFAQIFPLLWLEPWVEVRLHVLAGLDGLWLRSFFPLLQVFVQILCWPSGKAFSPYPGRSVGALRLFSHSITWRHGMKMLSYLNWSFFSTLGAEFEILWGDISEGSHIPHGDLVENVCRLSKLQRLWSEICVCMVILSDNIVLRPILLQRAAFRWSREMAD